MEQAHIHSDKQNATNLRSRNDVTLALGSRPRQGDCKVASQEGGLGVASHVLESAKSARSVRE